MNELCNPSYNSGLENNMTAYNMEQYMKDLEYLVNIDCNAHNFAGIDKVAAYLAKDFTDRKSVV